MKKLLVTAILFAGLGAASYAQQDSVKRAHKTPEERAKQNTEALAKKLSLTNEQKSKVYAINLESFNKMKAKHVEGQQNNRSDRKTAMDERDQQINAVLNDGQKKDYQEWKEKRESKMKDHKKKKRGDAEKA